MEHEKERIGKMMGMMKGQGTTSLSSAVQPTEAAATAEEEKENLVMVLPDEGREEEVSRG